MTDVANLKSAVESLAANSATEEARRVVREGILAGNIVYSAGEGTVAVGGDAKGTIIITGDQNQISFVLGEDNYRSMQEQLFPTPSGIPPPFPGLIFVGREEALRHVKSLLNGKDSASRSRSVVIRGWPGVGKTTLVSVLSRDPDLAESYPDGVLWAALGQKPMLLTILSAWADALGGEDLLRVPTPDQAVQEIFAEVQDRRLLMIVDDIWEAGHGALFQKARGERCAMLFTTRKPSVADALAQLEETIYNLPVLAEDDAVKLMRILAPDVAYEHPDETLKLVRSLECLPLALHVAAHLLRTELKFGWGVADLLNDINEGTAVIRAQAPGDRVEGDEIPTVKTLLQKSTDMLLDHTRECFALLGAFAPKPATFDMAAMKSVWEVRDPRPMVKELVDHGLIEPLNNGRFQMHALLVRHAKSLLTS